MQTLSKEYIALFNSITNALSELESIKKELISAQIQAESIYIDESDNS